MPHISANRAHRHPAPQEGAGPPAAKGGDEGSGRERAPAPDLLLYVAQKCFRAVNRPSGPEFGQTAIGKPTKSGLRPAGGPISVFSRQLSGQNLTRKADLRPRDTIA